MLISSHDNTLVAWIPAVHSGRVMIDDGLLCFSLHQCFCGVWCLSPAPGPSPSSCLQQIISSPGLAKLRPRGAWNKNQQIQHKPLVFLQKYLEYTIKPAVGREMMCLRDQSIGMSDLSVWRKTQHSEDKCWDYFTALLLLLFHCFNLAWRMEQVLVCCPLAAQDKSILKKLLLRKK